MTSIAPMVALDYGLRDHNGGPRRKKSPEEKRAESERKKIQELLMKQEKDEAKAKLFFETQGGLESRKASALALANAKINPVAALENADRYKDASYYEETLETAARIVAEKTPESAFIYSKAYKDKPYYAELIEKAVRTAHETKGYDWMIFKYAELYDNQPYYAEIIETIIRGYLKAGVYNFAEYVEKFKKMPWAEEVLTSVVEADRSLSVLEIADKIQDMPWAKKLIDMAGNNAGLEKTVMEAAKKRPDTVLKYPAFYKDQPHYTEAMEAIVRERLARGFGVMKLIGQFKQMPWAEEVLTPKIGDNGSFLLECADEIKDMPWAEKLIRIAADKNPTSTLQNAHKFKDQPYYADLAEKAARAILANPKTIIDSRVVMSNGEYIIRYADVFDGFPWQEEVVQQAATISPKTILEFAEKLKGKPWGDDLIQEVAKSNPDAMIANAEKLKDFPWARRAIMAAKVKRVLKTDVKDIFRSK